MKNLRVVRFIVFMFVGLAIPGSAQNNDHRAKRLRGVKCIRVDSFGKDAVASAFRGLVIVELRKRDHLKVTEEDCGDLFRLPLILEGSVSVGKTGEITSSASLHAGL